MESSNHNLNSIPQQPSHLSSKGEAHSISKQRQDCFDDCESPSIMVMSTHDQNQMIQSKNKKPLTSSELFNAFSNKQEKDPLKRSVNDNYLYAGQNMSKGGQGSQSHYAHKQVNQITSFQNKFQNSTINSDQDQLQNNDSFHIQGIQPYQQLKKPLHQQMQLVAQPLIMKGGRGRQDQQFVEDNSDDDSSGHNIDQEEQMMTEQDFDGQQDQDEEDDEEGQDYHHNDDSSEEEQEDDLERDNENSQEGNIQISSQSISPDGKILLNLGIKNGEEDIQDEYGEEVAVGDEKQSKYDESGSIRYSNIRSSGSPIMTSKSLIGQDMLSNNEKKEVIVERNERFIIYKMVVSIEILPPHINLLQPQINRNEGVKASKEVSHRQDDSSISQPTPVMFHKNGDIESKNYSETVEDNEGSSFSSEEENKDSAIYIENGKIQTRREESFLDEELMIGHEIKQIKNSSLINQSLNNGKPPIIKKAQEPTQSELQPNISRVIQINRASSLKNHYEQQKEVVEELDGDGNPRRMSSMQFSRSSSDRFNKLEKLEKKNIADDLQLEGTDLTLTKNFQSNLVTNQTTNESKENGNQQQKIFESGDSSHQQVYDRRASDSMILRSSMLKDSSQLDDSHEQAKKQEEKEQKKRKVVQKKEHDAELLKQEYLKLKRELNKMKKEPAKEIVKSKPVPKPTQKKQIEKSKKNLVLDTIDQSPQLQIQKAPDGEYLSNSSNDDSERGIYQMAQNRKSVTPSSIDKKQILKSKFMYNQKESAKAADGSKLQGLNQRLKMGVIAKDSKSKAKGNNMNKSQVSRDRETSKYKASQRASPNRDNIKSHRNILHNRHFSKQQKAIKTYDSETSLSKSHLDNSAHKSKHHHHHHQHKQSRKNNQKKHHKRKHSSSESEEEEEEEDEDLGSSECSHSQYSNEDQSEHSCSYSDSQSFIEDTSSVSSESESDTKSRHLRQIKKTTGGNHYHMHYKSKKGQRKDRKFKIRANTNETNLTMLTAVARPDRIMIDLTVKECKEGSHKKACVCTGYQFLCIQVFYQVQEVMSILQYYASTLTFFELINIYSDRKKLTLNCSKEQRSMQAIYNNQSQYVVCISQNIDCITPLAKYQLQSAASGFILPQQAFQQPMNLNLPLNLMFQQPQLQPNIFQQQTQNPNQQLFIQQQNQLNALSNIQQQQQQQINNNDQKHNMIFFSGLQNQQYQQRESQEVEIGSSRQHLPRNKSNNSLHQSHQQMNQQFGTSTNHSPKRSFRTQQDNFVFNNKSPGREHSYSQNNHEQVIPQKNYLNQLKNRFLQSNQQEDQEPINSRNPIYTHKSNNDEHQYHQKYNPTMFNMNSQTTSSYQNNDQKQYQHDQSKKPHFRTNSLMVDYQSIPEKSFQGMGTSNQNFQNQRSTFKYCEQEDEGAGTYQNKSKSRYTEEQINKSPDFNNILSKQESRLQSPNTNHDRGGGGDSCDNESMDEGVKASATRESALRSPKASTEFKSMLQKHSNVNQSKNSHLNYAEHNFRSPQNNSNTKKLSNAYHKAVDKSTPLIRNQDASEKQEQDKKGPQALYIGFNESQSQNPFAKKPQLKARAQNLTKPESEEPSSSLVNRSKSVKNGPPAQQKPSISTQKQMFVKQTKSPTNAASNDKPLLGKKDNKLTQFSSESPLKKAVADIKHKETVQRSSKVTEISINIVNPQAQKKEVKLINELDNDPSDPFHNKALAIEIFDKKKSSLKGKQAEVSLADMFKSKKKQIIEKLEHRKPQQDQDGLGQDEVEVVKEDQKQERTKQQILEMRKKMMKSKVKVKQDHFGQGGGVATPNVQNHKGEVVDGGKGQKGTKDVPLDLMKRLATGQKPQVRHCYYEQSLIQIDKKEMKNRTNKNYGNLPEVQKKKEEEKKKEELAARKAAAQEYAKQMEEKRRKQIQFKKKKSLANDDEK